MTHDELIELWCQALESGEYVQGKGFLKSEAEGELRHCCLGVACELAKANGVLLDERQGLSGIEFDGCISVLPKSVRDFFGLRALCGDFEDEQGEPDFLTDRNDKGTPFKEIAALIRSRPKGLFVEEL